MEQVKKGGSTICGAQRVRVARRFLKKRHRSGFAVCPGCREAYPVADGAMCLNCQGEDLYERANGAVIPIGSTTPGC